MTDLIRDTAERMGWRYDRAHADWWTDDDYHCYMASELNPPGHLTADGAMAVLDVLLRAGWFPHFINDRYTFWSPRGIETSFDTFEESLCKSLALKAHHEAMK